jgi:hypothetical protein
MMIWDPEMIMPSNDLFESQEPPAEVSVVQTHSKGPPVLKEIIVTQTSKNNTTFDHPKRPFSPSKGPIRIQTQELPK